ncbi:MFS transporter [Streptomyces sp. CS081A]|uniref:MFS transporter n=1 Tax=Streptomyces sp. CS081A TaxID=2162709 RepID=UPI000D5133CA|nr:MFS transporter [Streptomyces sp. CS081A]PVC69603.1 MFS transporter [Streptomyces sp. CS081A]
MKRRYSFPVHLTGAAVARTGDEMAGPALVLAGLALTGSAADASLLLAGVTVSSVLGGPVLGSLLDRAERPGRLLAAALALYAAGLTAVLVGLGRLPFALTLAAAALTGLLGPALSGGWTAQLPAVVRDDRLDRANALDAMTFGAAGLAGPALAGGTAEALGAPTAVVVSAALVALALPAAWALPARTDPTSKSPTRGGRPRPVPPGPAPSGPVPSGPAPSGPVPPGPVPPVPVLSDPAPPVPVPSDPVPPGPAPSVPVPSGPLVGPAVGLAVDIAAGLRAVVRSPALARATLTSVVSCTAQGMLTACLALLGERVLGGAGRGAMLLSCAAVSALAANAVLARFPRTIAPDTLLWTGALLQAAAPAAAVLGHPTVLVAAAFVAGIGEGPQLTALFAVRHREAPERLRSQVFTTGAGLKITGFALGAVVAGPVAARSLTGALLLATGTAVLAALAFFAVPAARGRAAPA